MVLPPLCLAADDVATARASATTAPPDQQVVALLNKLRQQVFAGQTTMPPSDNAVETWLQVTKLTASNLSPGAAKALDDFVQTAHSAQSADQAAGHGTAALDLLVFADFAVAELKEHPIDGALSPSGSSASPLRLSPPEHAVPAEVRKVDATAQPPVPDRHVTTIPTTLSSASTPATSPASAETSTEPTATADPGLMAAYVEHGDHMLAIKDISAARKFYEFAARAGSANAAVKLAETYDPDFLSRLGVVGLRPDVAKAVALYRQAAALGNTYAQDRVRMLNQEAAR